VALARALLYRVGAQALRHPGPGWLEEWDRSGRGVAAALEVLAPEGNELHEAFDRCWAASRDVERLRAEHGRVMGHSPRAGVTPYETEWTGAAGELLQYHQLADLAGFYRAFDLELARPCDERVDFLGVELTFLWFLCLKEAHAEEQGLSELADLTRAGQARFLEQHLLRWAPACCARCEELGGFHARAAEFLRRFLETERLRFALAEHEQTRAPRPSGLALEDCCIACSEAARCVGAGAGAGEEAHG
jgi:TorA maturation chaperone TorD